MIRGWSVGDICKDWLKEGNNVGKREYISARSATGQNITFTGKINIKIDVMGLSAMVEFLITEDIRGENALIGADWISSNLEVFKKVIEGKMLLKEGKKLLKEGKEFMK